VAAEAKLMGIVKRLGQWEQDYQSDERNIKMWRTLAARNPEKLKQYDATLPERLKQLQQEREQAKYGRPDIMTTIKQMREFTDMVLPQHKAVAPAPEPKIIKKPEVGKQSEVKQSSSKNKSVKKERCPNGTKRNTKTGKCKPK